MEKNILLSIQYDGSNFHGWQRQKGLRTAQDTVEKALSSILSQDITIEAVSRTDAGVHALDQKATLRGCFGIPTERLPDATNRILNKLSGANGMNGQLGDILISAAEEMPADFHARFSCKGKTYRYRIDNSGSHDVLNHNYACFVKEALDIDKMIYCSKIIEGTHDFAGFQSAGGTPRKTTTRTVSEIKIERSPSNIIDIFVTGDGFLYNMVRIISGTLIEVGLGKKSPKQVQQIIDLCDRRLAGFTAPPQALYLMKVYY